MANSRKVRSLAPGFRVGAATGVLAVAIVLVLAVVASPAAQAQTLHVIHTFTSKTDGGKPFAGVTIDRSGNLYGTTYAYGNPKGPNGPNYGVVYRMKPTGSGWTFNTLYRFTDGKDGSFPASRVIFGPNGTLYGTTQGDGGVSAPYGTVFNLKPPTTCTVSFCPWKITTLYAFKGEPDCNGQTNSFGDLVFDNAGNIYGTCYSGGAHNGGCVYKLTPTATGGYTEKVIYSFGSTAGDGQHPFTGVILDTKGNLYGTTAEGGRSNSATCAPTCGTVYELTPSSAGYTEKQLWLFNGTADGEYPFGGVIFDSAGNLYGSTMDGGNGGAGTAFKLTQANGNWSYSPLYSFVGGASCGPYGNLAFDAKGNLYGTTYCAGGFGNVFELTPSGTYTLLHSFSGGSDGANPMGNVTFDASGNVYGTDVAGANQTCTNSGPNTGCGVVWKITP